jgi:hypothetical protein
LQFSNSSNEGLIVVATNFSFSESYAPSPVPLPAAVYLLASALGVLAIFALWRSATSLTVHFLLHGFAQETG